MPLTFDLPLEELYEYRGINPRPPDFDDYWRAGLDELAAVDTNIELMPSEFQTSFADCFELYFTGVRGARVHAKLLHPKNGSRGRPGVIQFHGYTGNSGDWFYKLGLVAQGFTVAALDCRGQGGLSEDTGGVKGTTLTGHIIRGLDDRPENMLYRHIFLDTVQLTRVVMDMPEIDAARIGVTGGSQGGALTIACAALEPRIKLAAPIFPFLSDYKRVWEMDLAKDAYAEIKEFFRRHDPLHEREDALFEQLGYIDVQHLAPRIRAEVLMSVGLMDTICPPSSQFAAYNKIEAEKSLAIYPDFGHEELPGTQDRVFQFLSRL